MTTPVQIAPEAASFSKTRNEDAFDDPDAAAETAPASPYALIAARRAELESPDVLRRARAL